MHGRERPTARLPASGTPIPTTTDSEKSQCTVVPTRGDHPRRPLAVLLAAISPGAALAQGDAANPKPGRDPSQPIDEAYTKKIKEYTTEPFFLSPLVDYLPASKTVPTPKAMLGDIAGAPGKLPYSKEVYEYMRLLAKATPRVKVYSIGTTEEGREMIAVAIASEALMAQARREQGRRSPSSPIRARSR